MSNESQDDVQLTYTPITVDDNLAAPSGTDDVLVSVDSTPPGQNSFRAPYFIGVDDIVTDESLARHGEVLTVVVSYDDLAEGDDIALYSDPGSIPGPTHTTSRDQVFQGVKLQYTRAQLTSLGNGSHKFYYTATDRAGNIGGPSDTAAIELNLSSS
ncbi:MULTISPECIES: hypothetical protein [unclassified Nocardia]|uniref:hypothetical protein n=1 Tax=unclassified Nocardia TaxID=2637762 RepID=UPI002E121BB3|nr:hypothetical protein OG326_21265 [Nocardia sp. NBC_01327]